MYFFFQGGITGAEPVPHCAPALSQRTSFFSDRRAMRRAVTCSILLLCVASAFAGPIPRGSAFLRCCRSGFALEIMF